MENNFPILKGVKVVELQGYPPVAFLGKFLHDLGADVSLIKHNKNEIELMKMLAHLHEGKNCIKLDLKEKNQLIVFKKIIKQSDILIEGYRPGVLEKLNLNPIELTTDNKKLIVMRLTGYGQEGMMHLEPGHEINYLSLSGVLDFFRNEDNKIVNPEIILGDLFSGVLMPMYHLSQALLNRQINGGIGCVIDSSITTNLLSITAMANKLIDKEKHYFSCVTKNYEYLLFDLLNDRNLLLHLKKICERLIIEVLNTSDITEDIRLSITRDYIDYFDLITKSETDTKKYIKNLTKMLIHEDIIKNLKKFKFVKILPILQKKDLTKFFIESNLVKDNNDLTVINPFNIRSLDKKQNEQQNQINIENMLKTVDLSQEELNEIIKNNNLMKNKF